MARALRPDNCAECGSPLRTSGESIEDHPGTKLHFGLGLCSSCYGMQRPKPKYNAKTRAKLDATKKGLDSFLAERLKREQKRERLAKMRMVIR